MSCQVGHNLRAKVGAEAANFRRLARIANRSESAYAKHGGKLAAAKEQLARQRADQADHLATCVDCDGAA
jgi:hypothetical protein